MNEVLKAIAGRYSCRSFSSEALSNEQVKTLVEAALAAPSALNLQPWHIIAVTNKELIDEMDVYAMEMGKAQNAPWYERIIERGGKMFYNAPCILYILSDGSEYSILDCGIVSQNIALAAHSMGLGSVICGMARIPLADEKGETFKKQLQFPEGYTFGMSVCIGNINSEGIKNPHDLNMDKVSYVQ